MTQKKVLVVAAHADDEVLGCGGTIAKHRAAGDSVTVCFMTDGVGARGSGSVEARERDEAARAALSALDVDDFTRHAFPDNQMDTVPCLELAQAIEKVVAETQPDTVYTHHHGDLNVDHRATHEAVLTALRPQPAQKTASILTFEVMSSTEWRTPTPSTAFIPNWFVDISDYLDAKMNALACYDLEMRPWPHSRSLKALESLARHRGATMGFPAAEAFQLVRALR